jgi:hypothetical protein
MKPRDSNDMLRRSPARVVAHPVVDVRQLVPHLMREQYDQLQASGFSASEPTRLTCRAVAPVALEILSTRSGVSLMEAKLPSRGRISERCLPGLHKTETA